MRVYIPAIYRTKKVSGKEYFCKRLAESFKKKDVHIVESESERHDIVLRAGLFEEKKEAKVVFRLDGVYNDKVDQQKSKILNNIIKKRIRLTDAIVYQSQFSKIMCEKHLGVFDGPTTIINNGFDTTAYDNVEKASSNHEYNFLTAARWRPHKRLRDIIKSFRQAKIKNSCLYIAGDISESGLPEKKISRYAVGGDVVFLGQINQSVLSSYIKMCDCFVHLCWQDSCPNGVVEAIAAKKPVITNNVGGTQEIVKPSGGIICNIDSKYNYKFCDLYNPPSFDHNIISEAMKMVVSSPMSITNSHIDINYIADKYLSFFKVVLDRR